MTATAASISSPRIASARPARASILALIGRPCEAGFRTCRDGVVGECVGDILPEADRSAIASTTTAMDRPTKTSTS
ncbi:MAG: hypothetical protein R3F43_28030 [bacterium]